MVTCLLLMTACNVYLSTLITNREQKMQSKTLPLVQHAKSQLNITNLSDTTRKCLCLCLACVWSVCDFDNDPIHSPHLALFFFFIGWKCTFPSYFPIMRDCKWLDLKSKEKKIVEQQYQVSHLTLNFVSIRNNSSYSNYLLKGEKRHSLVFLLLIKIFFLLFSVCFIHLN